MTSLPTPHTTHTYTIFRWGTWGGERKVVCPGQVAAGGRASWTLVRSLHCEFVTVLPCGPWPSSATVQVDAYAVRPRREDPFHQESTDDQSGATCHAWVSDLIRAPSCKGKGWAVVFMKTLLWYTRQIQTGLCPCFLAQSSYSCRFPSDSSTRGTFWSNIWSLILVTHRPPRSLGTSCAIEASFVLMTWLWGDGGGALDGSWLGAGHQKDPSGIRSLEFPAPPPVYREGRGVDNGVDNWSYPREEASIKIPKVWGSRFLNTSRRWETDAWRAWLTMHTFAVHSTLAFIVPVV